MIGIYKITNQANKHSYVGQSRRIEERWKDHIYAAFTPINKAYDYPLQRAIRKYGVENFNFSILEECDISALNEREIYWISSCQPEYNQTEGGNYAIVPQKLTQEQVKEIQATLIADKEGEISHKDLAFQYGVHKDTIRDINVGRTWYDELLCYPLHYSKFDGSKPEELKKHFCPRCGVEISRGANFCKSCADKMRVTEKPVSREELKSLIRSTPFTSIGRKFGVSDNAIRKWCDSYGLPRRANEIKKFSEEEWEKV